ncbi:MAG: hypothetical protein ABEJ58_00745 [Halodesulfurarchaeum sp.]
MADSQAPQDRMRERAQENRFTLWFLLEADRWIVTGILLVIVFFTLLAVGYLYPTAESAIRTSDSVDTLFSGFLTATITVVTLVITLNQLVLSQELGAVGDQRERMEGAMTFREDVASVVESSVSPARPAQFLRALVQVSGERARDLREAIPETAEDELQSEVEILTESVIENAEKVSTGLDDATFGRFDVMSSALNFNYSWKIFTGRRIREEYRDALDEEGMESLESLIEVLQFFGPAREHFKTLFFQWDLIDLSRRMVATAIPALLVSGSMVIFFNDATFHLVLFDVEMMVFVIAAAATASVVPFLILLAYVVRIATVTKRTLSIGPFILRETDAVSGVEWND